MAYGPFSIENILPIEVGIPWRKTIESTTINYRKVISLFLIRQSDNFRQGMMFYYTPDTSEVFIEASTPTTTFFRCVKPINEYQSDIITMSSSRTNTRRIEIQNGFYKLMVNI